MSPSLAGKCVLCLGASGVSPLVLALSRHGLGRLILVDKGCVRPENLVRTAFVRADVGRSKAEALADHVRAATDTAVETIHADVLDLDLGHLGALVASADVLLAASDELAAQALFNRLAIAARKPAVFVGLHAGARGGIVTWCVPGGPCYRCVNASRYEAAERAVTAVDLAGEHGGMLDVGFIDAVAGKLLLGLLDRDEASAYGQFVRDAAGRHCVVVRMDRGYRWQDDLDLFDLVLSDLPTAPKDYRSELQRGAFFAMDSLWLPVGRDPDCPDCGQREMEGGVGHG